MIVLWQVSRKSGGFDFFLVPPGVEIQDGSHHPRKEKVPGFPSISFSASERGLVFLDPVDMGDISDIPSKDNV